MIHASEVSVTLTAELFDRLKAEARLLDVPMEWLVASLVADTFSESEEEAAVALV